MCENSRPDSVLLVPRNRYETLQETTGFGFVRRGGLGPGKSSVVPEVRGGNLRSKGP